MADNPGKASGSTKLGSKITDQSIGSILLGKDIQENAVPAGITRIDRLKVEDTNTFLLEQVLVELKIISMKLNCLQPNDEMFDPSDLDDLEQD